MSALALGPKAVNPAAQNIAELRILRIFTKSSPYGQNGPKPLPT
jgi:hypothetical protein